MTGQLGSVQPWHWKRAPATLVEDEDFRLYVVDLAVRAGVEELGESDTPGRGGRRLRVHAVRRGAAPDAPAPAALRVDLPGHAHRPREVQPEPLVDVVLHHH